MSVLILFGCYTVFALILVGFKHFGISFKERIGKHYFSLLLSFLLAAVLLLFYYFATVAAALVKSVTLLPDNYHPNKDTIDLPCQKKMPN